MKRIKKIVFVIITFILVLFFTFNLYNFICIKVLKHDLATVSGYAVLEVVSGSMEPSIHVGDLIIINTKDNDYKIDDVIRFYDKQGSFVTHRIIEKNDETLVTKGDNNNTEDEAITTSKIVGKYVFRINGGGKILNAFRNPVVMVMILLIGVIACVYMSLDKDGNVIISEEEKEFQEYLKNKGALEKSKAKKKDK